MANNSKPFKLTKIQREILVDIKNGDEIAKWLKAAIIKGRSTGFSFDPRKVPGNGKS